MPVPRKQPLRTCVACRTGTDKRTLIRFVRVAASSDIPLQNTDAGQGSAQELTQVRLDPTGRKAGRGAYLCASQDCFERALKSKALERALRCPISPADYKQLASEFVKLCAAEHDSVGTVIHG